MATTGNPYHYPEALLVEVQYIQGDKHTRMLKGDVTGQGWGRWKYGEKGIIHIADAIMFEQRRVIRPVDSQDYLAKKTALNRGEAILPEKSKARTMTLENIDYVGKQTIAKFAEAGIHAVQEVAELTPEKLVEIVALPHVNLSRAEAIIADAKEILESNGI